MASILSSTRVEPLFDDGVAPAVSTAPFSGVEETLAKLAHQAASRTPDPATLGPATLGPATLGAATLGPADLRAQIPREPRSRGKRRTLARVAIVVCLGVAALWAWRSYGEPAREVIAALAAPFGLTSARPAAEQPPVSPTPDPAPAQAAAPRAVGPLAVAPIAAEASPPPAQTMAPAPSAAPATNEPAAASADHQQIDAMAHDVAALRQTVEQLAAGQEQLKGELAKLEADKVAEKAAAEKAAAERAAAEKAKKRVVRHVPAGIRTSDAFDPAQSPNAPGAPRTIGTVVMRRGTPPSPPSTSGVSTLGPLPPPQSPAAPRPPMPVQQP